MVPWEFLALQFTSPIRRYVDLQGYYQERHARGRGAMKPVIRVNGIFCVMVTYSLQMYFTYYFVNPHCCIHSPRSVVCSCPLQGTKADGVPLRKNLEKKARIF